MKNKIILMMFFSLLLVGLKIEAFAPLTLVSFDVLETSISPNGDGVNDIININIEYSEEVKADINILDSNGNKVRDIYNSDEVTNPRNKIWDGKNNADQIVPNGVYTIEILGIATADPANTISDTSKTISVENELILTLSSITITTQPTKLNYTIGEELDITGLEITGTYSDESIKIEEITIENITGFDSSVLGEQVLTIIVGEKTVTYKVNINDNTTSVPNPVNIHLDIVNGDKYIYNDDLSVSPCDSDNNPETLDTITAYCAIKQLENLGTPIISEWNWAWAPGAFVDSIDGIVGYTSQDSEGNNVYHYWSWSENGNPGMTGLNQYELQADDSVLLEFVDPIEEVVQEDTTPSPTPEEPSSGGSSGGSSVSTKVFSIPQAISFLSSNQNSDGSFFNNMYTDWVAIGVAKAGSEAETIKTKIYNYLISQDFNSSILTDYERHAMALMALNINPYSGTNVDYIKKITDSFDGQQIGDVSLYNDDIFGLIILVKSGYNSSDNIISKTIEFIISKQQDNGSWDNVDITAAAIQALNNFIEVDGVSESILKGLNYLSSVQNSDGGFGDSFSTSWASQALLLNNTFVSQTNKTLEYLTKQQQDDGGVSDISNSDDSRVWATAYAIPAILKLSWNNTLNNFSKPVESISTSSSGGGSYTPVILDSSPEELPPSVPLPEEKPQDLIPELMAVMETIPQEKLLENIPEIKKPIKKIVFEEEKIVEVSKIDEVDDEALNLLQASAASSSKNGFLSGSKIILFVSGLLMIVLWGFVFKFRV